jgi:hypothetical protein
MSPSMGLSITVHHRCGNHHLTMPQFLRFRIALVPRFYFKRRSTVSSLRPSVFFPAQVPSGGRGQSHATAIGCHLSLSRISLIRSLGLRSRICEQQGTSHKPWKGVTQLSTSRLESKSLQPCHMGTSPTRTLRLRLDNNSRIPRLGSYWP